MIFDRLTKKWTARVSSLSHSSPPVGKSLSRMFNLIRWSFFLGVPLFVSSTKRRKLQSNAGIVGFRVPKERSKSSNFRDTLVLAMRIAPICRMLGVCFYRHHRARKPYESLARGGAETERERSSIYLAAAPLRMSSYRGSFRDDRRIK